MVSTGDCLTHVSEVVATMILFVVVHSTLKHNYGNQNEIQVDICLHRYQVAPSPHKKSMGAASTCKSYFVDATIKFR